MGQENARAERLVAATTMAHRRVRPRPDRLNARQIDVDGQFNFDNARIKLKYPCHKTVG